MPLITIREAIQNRAPCPFRRARIFHRHHALALADEHALSHHDRRCVADDDARMRRRQARSGAVWPDDRVACQDAVSAVVATHVEALTGAVLRLRGPGAGDDRCRYQNRENNRPIDRHAVPPWVNRCRLPSSPVRLLRLNTASLENTPPAAAKNYPAYSIGCGNVRQ